LLTQDCDATQEDEVTGAANRDSAAINVLFAQCIPRLRKMAARLLQNEPDCEDVLQEALLSAFRHLHQFKGRARLSTWMHAILLNAARSRLRKRRSQPLISSLDQPVSPDGDTCVADVVADPRPNIHEDLEQEERWRALSEAVQELSPVRSAVFQLHDVEGLQMKDVADRLGLTISAVKTHHFRANREILRVATRVRHRSRRYTVPR
jgi:RNA polymerase sigma-70 factor, ECF subfamily